MIRALPLAVVAACWTTASAPPVEPTPPAPSRPVARRAPPPSECERAVDHLVEIERDELVNIPDFADKIDAIREVAVGSCEDTHWTPELMHCFGDVADQTMLSQCQSLFTSDQTSDLMRRVTEILTGLSAPPPISP